MCDYDWTYEEISSRMVTTRKRHECGSCQGYFAAGTRMQVAVGLTDGDLGRTYCCPACKFALNQPDETELHLCWGWNWHGDSNDYSEERWQYIHDTLAKGETPTVEGVQEYLKTKLVGEDA